MCANESERIGDYIGWQKEETHERGGKRKNLVAHWICVMFSVSCSILLRRRHRSTATALAWCVLCAHNRFMFCTAAYQNSKELFSVCGWIKNIVQEAESECKWLPCVFGSKTCELCAGSLFLLCSERNSCYQIASWYIESWTFMSVWCTVQQ